MTFNLIHLSLKYVNSQLSLSPSEAFPVLFSVSYPLAYTLITLFGIIKSVNLRRKIFLTKYQPSLNFLLAHIYRLTFSTNCIALLTKTTIKSIYFFM